MTTIFRLSLLTIAGLSAAVAVAVAGLLLNSERILRRQVEVHAAPVPYATSHESLSRGEYLYKSRDCAACHGDRGEGHLHIDDPIGLKVRSANLTLGKGSAVTSYGEIDWVHAIRHGIKPDGRPLFLMPSEVYSRLTDADLADLVAYVRSLPPQDSQPAAYTMPLAVRLLHGAGQIPDAAAKIDHSLPPQAPLTANDVLEQGRYVAQTCTGCHGAQLKGGPIPGAPPSWPPAANLNAGAGGAMQRYASVETFETLMRTGRRPDGNQVAVQMPTNVHLNGDDMNALFAFLRSPR